MDTVQELFSALEYKIPEVATVDHLKPKRKHRAEKQPMQAAPVRVSLGRKKDVDTLMMKKAQLSKSSLFSKVYIERYRPYSERLLETNLRRVAKVVSGLEFHSGMLRVKDK